MIIDSHAHIFPSKIAERAVDNIGKFYDLPMLGTGNIEQLIKSGGESGIGGFIVNSSATSAKQVEQINKFIVESVKDKSNVWGLCTIHQDLDEAAIDCAIKYAVANNLIGVKLHPDFQKFYIDDPSVYKLYEACNGVFPILMHTGDSRYDYSSPMRLATVAKDFPNLNFIAAHFGGYERWSEVECYKGLDNVYIDSSSTLFKLPYDRAHEIINIFGEDRLLFGVDYPMWDYAGELNRFNNLNLSGRSLEKAMYLNAARLYKLSIA